MAREDESSDWIPISSSSEIPNSVIKTLHKDGTEDIHMVFDGKIYSYDPKTISRITHYKIQSLREPPSPSEGIKDKG